MKISIVTPTYNEQENIELLYNEIRNIFLKQKINYEHIVIDNNSNDNTQFILKKLANEDKNLKLILNFITVILSRHSTVFCKQMEMLLF
jgi:glycosyltransferase involved in cell wall biosynthesis